MADVSRASILSSGWEIIGQTNSITTFRSLQFPRLWRNENTTTSYAVDGKIVSSLDQAVHFLIQPPAITDTERGLLLRLRAKEHMEPSKANFDDMNSLFNKGLIDDAMELTDEGFKSLGLWNERRVNPFTESKK